MERKAEDNKEKEEEKMTYEPPELIDLAGEVAKGACAFGAGDNFCQSGGSPVLG